jgi:hypothetical protein
MYVKAIETEYDGHRFRSRSEARWAVFFNALGVPYEYEKEGFDLEGVGRYLPDFWLPEQDFWIEIKGSEPTSDEGERASALARATGKRVFVFFGDIPQSTKDSWGGEDSAHLYCTFQIEGENEVGWDSYYCWCECPRCEKVGIEFSGRFERLCDCVSGDKGLCNSLRIQAAYKAARSARFEHGETPQIPAVVR